MSRTRQRAARKEQSVPSSVFREVHRERAAANDDAKVVAMRSLPVHFFFGECPHGPIRALASVGFQEELLFRYGETVLSVGLARDPIIGGVVCQLSCPRRPAILQRR